MEVLEGKFRQESIQDRRTPLDEYLRTYFTLKYGKPLAEQNEASFREAVGLLARAQERHLFLLFQAILEEQCEEAYYFEDKQAHERIAKCIRRYTRSHLGTYRKSTGVPTTNCSGCWTGATSTIRVM